MEYRVVTVPGSGLAGTDFAKASEKLAEQVNEALREGWKPQGGVAVGLSQITHEPFLLQALVRP